MVAVLQRVTRPGHGSCMTDALSLYRAAVVLPSASPMPSSVLLPKPRAWTVIGPAAWVAVTRNVPERPVMATGVARASNRPSMIRTRDRLAVEAADRAGDRAVECGVAVVEPGTPSVCCRRSDRPR